MLAMAQNNIARHGGVEAMKVSTFSMSILLSRCSLTLPCPGAGTFSGVCSARAGPAGPAQAAAGYQQRPRASRLCAAECAALTRRSRMMPDLRSRAARICAAAFFGLKCMPWRKPFRAPCCNRVFEPDRRSRFRLPTRRMARLGSRHPCLDNRKLG